MNSTPVKGVLDRRFETLIRMNAALFLEWKGSMYFELISLQTTETIHTNMTKK